MIELLSMNPATWIVPLFLVVCLVLSKLCGGSGGKENSDRDLERLARYTTDDTKEDL